MVSVKRKSTMPMRYGKRRRTAAPRRTFRGKYPKAKTVFAKKVRAVMAKTVEQKFIYTQQVAGPLLNNVPNFQSTIADCLQGLTNNTRIGERISPQSVEVNYRYINTTAFTCYVRVAVIKITTQVATVDLLDTSRIFWSALGEDPVGYSTISAADPWRAFTSKFDPKQVTVIFDKVFKLSKTAETAGTDVKSFRKRHKLTGKIDYDIAATAGANLQSTRYYTIQLVHSPVPGGSVAIDAFGFTKLKFIDA